MSNPRRVRSVRKVLLVDDETPFLRSLLEAFKAHKGTAEFEFLTATNGEEAVELLKRWQVDLVVTDLNMPRMDGFELLSRMGQFYDEVPVIVMTAFGTDKIQDRATRAGAVRFIDKPIDFEELVGLIHELLAASARGFITGIQIREFIQIVNAGKKSCTLHVTCGSREGQLYFFQGDLVDAKCDGKTDGRQAALDIVTWEDASIHIRGNIKKRENRIKMSANVLVMEAMYQKDEQARGVSSSVNATADEFDQEFVFSAAAPDPDSVIMAPSSLDGVENLTVSVSPTPTGFGSDGAGGENHIPKEMRFMVTQAQIDTVLSKLDGIDGGHGGLLVDGDGMVIASRLDRRYAGDKIAALTTAAIKTASKVVVEAGFGQPDTMLIEGTDGKMCLVHAAGSGFFISLLGSKDLNIGMARMALQEAIDSFSKI